MGRKIAGPGRMGSTKAVKDTLKKSGTANVKTIPGEDSLTVRFLDEPEDFHGFYQHWMSKGGPIPCTTDECAGCESDDPEEQRKSFRYLANAYIVDDQKVWALLMPKSLVEMLMNFHKKYKGTLLDRDYELSRTGSGKEGTKYMAAPEERHPMKLSRFDSKKFDLSKVLQNMLGDDDDDDDEEDEPVRKKKTGPKKSRSAPWDDDDDDDDEPVVKKRPVKKKSSASSKTSTKRTVGKKTAVRRRIK
jgi:hypothetical protein